MTRREAELAYRIAVKERRALESATLNDFTEEEFNIIYKKACDVENASCAALVQAEIANPTKSEIKRANNAIYLRNRGYDI